MWKETQGIALVHWAADLKNALKQALKDAYPKLNKKWSYAVPEGPKGQLSLKFQTEY